MVKLDCNLTINSWSINSANDPRTELIALKTKLAIGSPADVCRISVYAPPAPKPDLLEQAIGEVTGALGDEQTAFAVPVHGNEIKPGDSIEVELTSGERSSKVVTAEVTSVCSSLGQTGIVGATGMQKLAHAHLNQVYENQSLDQIVSDLAGQVDVGTGEIETGSTYVYFVVHEAKSVLQHILELAKRDGLEVYVDPDNKLNLTRFVKSSADHIFHYGVNILDLRLFNRQPTINHVRVYGESPSSNQGTETWHWLVKDLSPFQSDVGDGSRLLAIQDRAIRTKDSADQFATAKYGAITDQATRGRLKILGNPTVKVADAIEIKNVPQPHVNGLFKVTSVRHLLNKQSGYLTFVDFTGQGGTEAASGLLDGASGAINL